MKVTVNGLIFDGTAAEIYDVLFKLGYAVDKKNTSYIPYTLPLPHTPMIPQWTHPIQVGDPPPGTFPQVWSGGGSNIQASTPNISGIVNKVISRNDEALKKMTDN